MALQDDSVFADFDVDQGGRVGLVRISFDGYGCCQCDDSQEKIGNDDSGILLDAVQHQALENSQVEAILRAHFRVHSASIGRDPFTTHDLL
ncbi:MAG: hypothetical protein QM715_01285 [Nibricoccus sp.]